MEERNDRQEIFHIGSATFLLGRLSLRHPAQAGQCTQTYTVKSGIHEFNRYCLWVNWPSS
jgi:hypothetical protein